MVCEDDYEMRHEQQLIQIPRERGGVAWSRREAADTFVFGGADIIYDENGVGITPEYTTDLYIMTEG